MPQASASVQPLQQRIQLPFLLFIQRRAYFCLKIAHCLRRKSTPAVRRFQAFKLRQQLPAAFSFIVFAPPLQLL